MSEKLEVKIGPLRLTPLGVEAEGVAKGDGQETVLYICGQPHHLNPGMNWNESALICGCDERKTREILEHPVTQERMTEAKAMLLQMRKSDLQNFLDRLALVEMEKPTISTSEQGRGCRVTRLEISTREATGAASESYVEAIGEAALNCAGSILKAGIYLSAQFGENGEPVTNLYISQTMPEEVSDDEVEAAGDAISAHAGVRGTLAQMRRDLIDVARASTRQELDWLKSIA